jgi:hypothetical protein
MGRIQNRKSKIESPWDIVDCLRGLAMKIVLNFILTAFLATFPYTQINAQTALSYSRNVEVLQLEEPSVIVVKREVIPGVVTFTRYNGCALQIPVSTNFLDNGTTLKTPAQLAISGNSIPQWRNEYRKPWKSEFTDYERGEYKIMIFQIGQHPSTLIGVEQSEKQLLDAQTNCAAAAYRIFGSNLKLLQAIPNQKRNTFSLPLSQGWERLFSN